MALPTTITGAAFASAHRHTYCGPLISSSGNVYVIAMVNGTTNFGAYKATDPTSSFSEVDSANRPNPGAMGNVSLNVCQDGDTIHIAAMITTPSAAFIYYAAFDMATDTWGTALFPTGGSTTTTSDALGLVSSCDIAVLSTGTIRIVSQGAQVKVMGTAYAQVVHYVSTDSGSTWSAATTINGGTTDDYTGPRIVLPPANSDQCHILYRRATSGQLYQRAISSAGTLRTERATGINNLDVYGVSNVLGFDRT